MRFGWIAAAAACVMAVPASAATYVFEFTFEPEIVRGDIPVEPDQVVGLDEPLALRVGDVIDYTVRFTEPLVADQFANVTTGLLSDQSNVVTTTNTTETQLFDYAGPPLFPVGSANLAASGQVELILGARAFEVAPLTYTGFRIVSTVSSLVELGFPIETLIVDRAYLSLSIMPDPSTWAMMIGGIGAIGGSLRRRAALTPQRTG